MKIHLLKKLLILSPVVVSPMLATSCGCSRNNDKGGDKIDALKLKAALIDPNKVVAPGKFYLDFYQRELNAIWATKTTAINAAASDTAANHQYDLGINLVDAVLPKVKTDGAAEFKKVFPTLDDYDADIFDDITVSFNIPDDSKGNLKVADNGILSVYPSGIISGASSEKQIGYTLKLNNSKVTAKDLSGSLKFDLQSKFINYNASNELNDSYVTSAYGNADMSTILVGEYGGGLDVGTKQSNGGYKFDNYSTKSTGKEKLASNDVEAVYGATDMSTILVGEEGGGLDVGTRAKAGDPYTFDNYKTGEGLVNNKVTGLYGNADLSTILVGTNGGLSVGTKAKAGDPYTFTSYKTTQGLTNNNITSVFANNDLSTILVGETGGGIDVGTKADAADPYTFDNYKTNRGLVSNDVTSLSGTANLSTILVGTSGGLNVGTIAGGSYTFKTYNGSKPSGDLASPIVNGVYGNTDLSTILVAEFFGGLSVGKRQANGDYNFTNYSGIKSTQVNVTTGNADLSAILVGSDKGLDISSNLWFA